MNYPKTIQNLIECFKSLPGVGEKTAERLALSLLNFDEEMVKDWIAAVKGVLEGKKLQQINYKTDAAKKFFVR